MLVCFVQTDQAVTLLDSAEGIVGSLDLDATVNVTEPFIGEYNYLSHTFLQ